jgi:CheY-like chemotaxis protein
MNKPARRRLAPMVLVADHLRNAADSLALFLSSIGYRTAVVRDGYTALALLKVLQPQVAVLNYAMPGMTALEIMEELKAEGIRTKIIMMSSYPPEPFVRLAKIVLAKGAEGVLTVPFKSSELVMAVADALPAKKPLR